MKCGGAGGSDKQAPVLKNSWVEPESLGGHSELQQQHSSSSSSTLALPYFRGQRKPSEHMSLQPQHSGGGSPLPSEQQEEDPPEAEAPRRDGEEEEEESCSASVIESSVNALDSFQDFPAPQPRNRGGLLTLKTIVEDDASPLNARPRPPPPL